MYALPGDRQGVSNLGHRSEIGQRDVTCPWCQGGAIRLTGIDAQAAWLEGDAAGSGGGEAPAGPATDVVAVGAWPIGCRTAGPLAHADCVHPSPAPMCPRALARLKRCICVPMLSPTRASQRCQGRASKRCVAKPATLTGRSRIDPRGAYRQYGRWDQGLAPYTRIHRRIQMFYRLRQRTQNEGGFTLIELLVVILIIGILSAIAIPAFLSQKSKANDAGAKTQVGTLQTAMETYSTENSGSYVGAEIKALEAIEPTLKEHGQSVPAVLAATERRIRNRIGVGRQRRQIQVRQRRWYSHPYLHASGQRRLPRSRHLVRRPARPDRATLHQHSLGAACGPPPLYVSPGPRGPRQHCASLPSSDLARAPIILSWRQPSPA